MTPGSSESVASGGDRWRQLRYTPLRDVIRGRMTGRLDLDAVLARYGLAGSVAAMVKDVAKRTRLWRIEKAAVAEELSAHFADGLEAGRTGEQLIADFGDAKQAAKLLRRSVKRSRPAPWRAMMAMLKGIGGLVLLLIVVWCVSAVPFFFGSKPQPVDFRPAMNRLAIAVPQNERAWPHYRAALLALEDLGEEQNEGYWRPNQEKWPVWEAYLLRNQEALALAREARDFEGLGFVVGYDFDEADLELWPQLAESDLDVMRDGVITILMPHYAALQNLSKTMMQDVYLAAEQGDSERVLANLETMFAMALQIRETPVLIGDLVSTAIAVMTIQTAGEVLASKPEVLNEDELGRLAHALAKLDDETMKVRIASERYMFEDVMNRVYSDDGNGDGHLTFRGLRELALLDSLSFGMGGSNSYEIGAMGIAGPALNLVMLSKKDMLSEYDRLMGLMQSHGDTPMWLREASEVENQLAEWASSRIDSIRYMPLVMLMPALSRALQTGDLALMQRDGLMVVIGLELHRRRTGEWPSTLAELDDMLLPIMPRDRFDGRQLRYRLTAEGPVVYSVGTNRVDDGGTRPSAPIGRYSYYHNGQRWVPEENLESLRQSGNLPDVDWVIWPPAPELEI